MPGDRSEQRRYAAVRGRNDPRTYAARPDRIALAQFGCCSARDPACTAGPNFCADSIGQNHGASIVEIQRCKFYDACFYATIGSVVETATDIRVNLKIEHKQVSGRCGCRSANLRLEVFAKVDVYVSPDTPLGGMRLVETTAPFRDASQQHAVTITKLKSEPPQHYKLWLACAD